MPNLVITVTGGVMSGVMTDDDPTTPIRIILIDLDNIEAGDPETGVVVDLEPSTEEVDKVFDAYDGLPVHLSGPNGCEPGCPACEATHPNFPEPTNVNCLEGLRCPKCGGENSFGIGCKTFATVTDDGIDDYGDMEWDGESYMTCQNGGGRDGCTFDGTVAEFRIKESN